MTVCILGEVDCQDMSAATLGATLAATHVATEDMAAAVKFEVKVSTGDMLLGGRQQSQAYTPRKPQRVTAPVAPWRSWVEQNRGIVNAAPRALTYECRCWPSYAESGSRRCFREGRI